MSAEVRTIALAVIAALTVGCSPDGGVAIYLPVAPATPVATPTAPVTSSPAFDDLIDLLPEPLP